jgi:hypothetical protein
MSKHKLKFLEALTFLKGDALSRHQNVELEKRQSQIRQGEIERQARQEELENNQKERLNR